MRAGHRSITLTALALLPVACAVYTDDALKPLAGTAKSGSSGSAGGGSGPSVSAGSAGKPLGGSTGAGGTSNETHAGNGGQAETSASGDGSGDSGETAGGAANGGKASAGAGGSAAGNGGVGSGNGGVNGTSGASGSAGTSGTGGSAGASGTGGASGTSGGGNGGSAGGATAPACKDHPLTDRSTWVASASISDTVKGDVPANLLDDKLTRWTTGKPQVGGEWLQIDFGATVTLNHVNLQQGTDTNDYPRSYAVFVADAAKDPAATARGSGSGKSGVSTAILLPALATGRFLWIKQSGSSLSWWSAEEIEVSCSE